MSGKVYACFLGIVRQSSIKNGLEAGRGDRRGRHGAVGGASTRPAVAGDLDAWAQSSTKYGSDPINRPQNDVWRGKFTTTNLRESPHRTERMEGKLGTESPRDLEQEAGRCSGCGTRDFARLDFGTIVRNSTVIWEVMQEALKGMSYSKEPRETFRYKQAVATMGHPRH